MAYRAFISSTYEDLKRHRAHVITALRRSGFTVDPMEDWPASAKAPSVFSQERIEGCDLCLLLVARRRGHVPRGRRKSITQLEYEASLKLGVDVLAFLLADDASWPEEFDELDRDEALHRWRSELVETRGVEQFQADPRSLDIGPALLRWVSDRQFSEFAAGRLPERMPWHPKAVRLGRRAGLLTAVGGKIEFTEHVAETLRELGDGWIRGEPPLDSTRVYGSWKEYSTMAIVHATAHDALLTEAEQDIVYIECHNQLLRELLELAVASSVMTQIGDKLSAADDLSEEMLATFAEPEQLEAYVPESGDLRDAAMLAFVDMVRARLLIHAPEREAFAEVLGTLVLDGFGFWHGPANAPEPIRRPSTPSRGGGGCHMVVADWAVKRRPRGFGSERARSGSRCTTAGAGEPEGTSGRRR